MCADHPRGMWDRLAGGRGDARSATARGWAPRGARRSKCARARAGVAARVGRREQGGPKRETGGGSKEEEERRGERREEGAGRRRDQGAGRQQAWPGRCSLPGRLFGSGCSPRLQPATHPRSARPVPLLCPGLRAPLFNRRDECGHGARARLEERESG